MAGGHGYGDDGGELRSVVCARGKQRREWGPGGERGGAGARASTWRREGVGEAATAKQEVAGALRARATPRLCLLAEEEEDKGEGGGLGLAGPVLLGHQVGFTGKSFSLLFLFWFSFLFLQFVFGFDLKYQIIL